MRKHPSGLPFLFFTEMWERFGYYLMIGIFVLYMTDTQKGGLEFERGAASDVYGTFIALVYITPFIGGLLADRVLGYRRSIVIGGILMGIGYLLLAIPQNMTAFYAALGTIILGNGFFKPNISTLLGNLYNEERYQAKKDDGYSIFYMGINVGALICNFVAAYLRNTYGWGKVNVMIDDAGTICAAANLMVKAGQRSLVLKTAKQNNFLRFADVRSGALMTWMLKSGLTQEEIAVIQEPYVFDRGDDPSFEKQEDDRLYTHFMTTIEQLEKNTAASLDIAVARLLAA